MYPIPGLGRVWPDTFGSHCVRWTNEFMTTLNGLPGNQFWQYIWMRQVTLRYPRVGGPEHSIVLVRVRGRVGVVGIDNGSLNNGNNLFDPQTVIDDPQWPQELRDDLRDALRRFLMEQ
jgi:hypothetical protein